MYFHRNIVATAVRVSVHRMAECRKKLYFPEGLVLCKNATLKSQLTPRRLHVLKRRLILMLTVLEAACSATIIPVDCHCPDSCQPHQELGRRTTVLTSSKMAA